MQRKSFIRTVLSCYTISFLLFLSGLWAQPTVKLQTTVESLKAHVKYLASDELEGRRSGSEGAWKAAKFIANYFKENGIEPLSEQGYFQEFMVETDVKLLADNFVTVDKDGKKFNWKAKADYTPLAFSKDTTLAAEVVFAGYGISSEENKYDDYQNLNVKGKIAIVFRGAPDWGDPHKDLSFASTLRYKTTTAREKGAVGIIFVNAEADSNETLVRLYPDNTARSAQIIALHVLRSKIQELLPAGVSLDSIRAHILKTQHPESFPIRNVSLTVSVDLKHIEKPTANVIGWVKGTDPALADEYIVVGAHYDHLGWGGPNSRYEGKEPAIHHGADDNASGTSAVMELAKRIAAHPLPRPIIFMAFSGEELGLLGSSFYVNHPLVPLEKTICMLNLDMVGRMQDHKLNVHGVGTSDVWEPLVDSLANRYGFKLSKAADGYGPSDQSSFYAKNLPVLFFFTGLHSDYHRPSDTWEKLNYEKMAEVIDYVQDILTEVASRPNKPKFVKVKSSRPSRSMAFRVYVGTIPDYGDNPLGLAITGVREGSPAAKGGLKGGDIMIEFGGIPIKNIYDYTYALGKFKPGDKVKVVVLRGADHSQKVTLEVTLGSRK